MDVDATHAGSDIYAVGSCLKITKLSVRQDKVPEFEPTISLNHWAVGFLVRPITIGESIILIRFLDDDRIAYGQFGTSPIEEVMGPFLKTENSVYKIEEVERIEVITKK